jgi:energy-coupling factor transporter ATP-binding protein EcfA2
MIIKSIQIKNFRSIVNEKINSGNLTVFVGNNDAGKSNIIKALNLFFNDETDFNTPFAFERDYSVFAPSRKKMAEEISITLEIIPPESYKASKNIIWNKTWRRIGLVKDNKTFSDKSSIAEERSRISFWIDHIVFRYIPAIKSDTYFQELLGDLHDTLTSTFEGNMDVASTEFTIKLQENTKEITTELTKRLQISSTLHLPTNLRQLFHTLDFQTKMGKENISLNNRGDGIKSRHIPIILKFISEQENKTRTQGAPRISTIWGYEEPENNLELRKSFELAKDFYEYSNTIQMFITTHSPSFYGIKRIADIFPIKSFNPKDINVYYISNNEELNGSSKPTLVDDDIRFINDQLGLLPIITPYIIDKNIEVENLSIRIKHLIQEQREQTCPTILVEGITDQKILIKAIQLFSPRLSALITNGDLLVKSEKSAGVNWVSDSVKAWVYGRKSIKLAAILDYDDAGHNCKDEIEKDKKCRAFSNEQLLKIIQLHKPDNMRFLYSQGIKLPITLEELYPFNIWEYAQRKKYFSKSIPLDKSATEYLLNDKRIQTDLVIYCTKKVKIGSKEKLVSYLLKLPNDQLMVILANFIEIITKLENHFIPSS